jgi:xylulose-5-phosphate/fructose-6-phosphate phosphoketolase
MYLSVKSDRCLYGAVSMRQNKIWLRVLRYGDFASDVDPQIVFAACGDYPTLEAMAAMSLVRQHAPGIRMRFVSVTALSALGIGNTEHRLLKHDFFQYFGHEQPVIFNFHGYPQTIKQILFDYTAKPERFVVHGYEETGSTTTPFDMLVRNRVDRFHLAMDAFAEAAKQGLLPEADAQELMAKFQEKLAEHTVHMLWSTARTSKRLNHGYGINTSG